jgi:hypothetical protein
MNFDQIIELSARLVTRFCLRKTIRSQNTNCKIKRLQIYPKLEGV